MKHFNLALATVTAMFVCGFAHAQEAENEKNIEYEKLKVLEPMVGTYHNAGKIEETGRVWETRATIAWSDSKKMLIRELTWRAAETEAELAEQEWQPLPNRTYFAWNHSENRIERIYVLPRTGLVTISEVKHEGDNVFAYLPISNTAARVGKSDFRAVVTKEGISLEMTNRQNAEGDPLEDFVRKMKRIQ
jgi:hypothetical protein